MLPQIQNAPAAAELLGDLRLLVEQLGSPDGLAALAGTPGFAGSGQLKTLPQLRSFLRNYQDRILCSIELPAIHRAFGHASHGEVRELVALDGQLSREPMLQCFASASRRVGQAQLQRLRPLRDDRTVQRYLAAVDSGAAQGWHTLVYGLTLAIYSLPLRQGLLHYAEQATRSFIASAGFALDISKEDSQELFEELARPLPRAVEALLTPATAVPQLV